MIDFIEKPEDYDSVVHGETRFVIVEKQEDISYTFIKRMRYYWKITRKNLLFILNYIVVHKSKN